MQLGQGGLLISQCWSRLVLSNSTFRLQMEQPENPLMSDLHIWFTFKVYYGL